MYKTFFQKTLKYFDSLWAHSPFGFNTPEQARANSIRNPNQNSTAVMLIPPAPFPIRQWYILNEKLEEMRFHLYSWLAKPTDEAIREIFEAYDWAKKVVESATKGEMDEQEILEFIDWPRDYGLPKEHTFRQRLMYYDATKLLAQQFLDIQTGDSNLACHHAQQIRDLFAKHLS